MTLDQALPALKARWRLAAVTALVVVAAVAAATVALPPRFEATAAIAVEMTGTDPIGGQAVFKPAGSVSTYVATQADIIRSEAVALRALRALELQRQDDWREKWQASTGGRGELEPWLAAQLLRRLEVRPSRDSNVLTIGYASSDPAGSAAIANAFVRSYIDTTLQMQVMPARRFNAFFAERAQPLRDALEQARGRLSAYEKEHGVTVGNEPDFESARLSELTAQLVTLQDSAAEAASVRKQAQSAPTDMREVRNDPEVTALTAELARQESRLTELRAEFGDKHYAVIQARESVNDVRRRLNGTVKRMAESLAAPAKVLETRVAEVKAAIERQRAVVLKRKSQRDAAAALLRDVENAEKAYSAVLNRASETALEGANTTQTSISVLKSATPPLWSPAALIRNLIVATVLGLLLGIAHALFAESRDRRLRTIEDVTRRLRQPLLLDLPDGRRWRGRSEHTQQRLVPLQRRRLAAPL
jgi:polysaccharide biosynthesis transport protein